MDKDDKKYYFGLLKRYGLVVGSALIISYGVHLYKKNKKTMKNIENIVDSSEIIVDSLENFNNYPVKFKN